MKLYLDTSALVPLFLTEAHSVEMTYLVSESDGVMISDLAAGEFGAAISAAVRMRRIAEADAADIFRHFDQWRRIHPEWLVVQPRHMELADDLVRRFDLALRLPDALHVAICLGLPVTLVTGDMGQAMAAEALGADVHRV